MKESITCKYSATCFTCPLEDCRIDTKKAPFYNKTDYDSETRLNTRYILSYRQKGVPKNAKSKY